jgi:hypothetical protein
MLRIGPVERRAREQLAGADSEHRDPAVPWRSAHCVMGLARLTTAGLPNAGRAFGRRFGPVPLLALKRDCAYARSYA